MRLLLASVIFSLAFPSPLFARDYGQQGAYFKIIEPDLLEQIQTRLNVMDKNGDIDRLNQKLKTRTIARVNRPKPVAGLIKASRSTTRLFDPTITLQEDIFDHKKRKIWPKGTKVNPLDTVPLRSALIFMDGDDPDQLEWAFDQKASKTAKLILTNGAPLKLMKSRQRRFYFDQGGKLVRHFEISALPAMVDQHGRMLRIRQFALPKHRSTVQ